MRLLAFFAAWYIACVILAALFTAIDYPVPPFG